MSNYKKTICIDFDGVLHSYTSPWKGAEVIPDPPVPGAFEFIQQCIDAGFAVAVFSTRNFQEDGRRAMKEWFKLHGFSDVLRLGFPLEKPMAILYIDDRAFQFRGIWPTLEYIQNFKTWNK